MTLDDLLIDCCTRLNYPPDLAAVDAKVKARLTSFLNQTQLEILGQPTYRRLLRGRTQLLTAAGVWSYGLPSFVARIAAILDPARQVRLSMMSTDAYRRYIPNPNQITGNPVRYAFDGWSTTQRQPSVPPMPLFVFSPADTAPTTIHFKANWFDGPPMPTGSYAENEITVPLDSALPFPGKPLIVTPAFGLQIYEVFISKPAVGIVSVVENDLALSPLTQIQSGQTRTRSAQIYLAPTPSGPFLLDVYFERESAPLVNPGDEPYLPPRFQHLLAIGARMKEYELRGDMARHALASREYNAVLAFFNSWIADQPDASDQMVPDDGHFGGASVLGPWFPASGYRGF